MFEDSFSRDFSLERLRRDMVDRSWINSLQVTLDGSLSFIHRRRHGRIRTLAIMNIGQGFTGAYLRALRVRIISLVASMLCVLGHFPQRASGGESLISVSADIGPIGESGRARHRDRAAIPGIKKIILGGRFCPR